MFFDDKNEDYVFMIVDIFIFSIGVIDDSILIWALLLTWALV